MELNIEEVKIKLKENLSENRYNHVLRVYTTALELNKKLKLNLDEKKLEYATLLHDCAKGLELKYFNELKRKYNLEDDILIEKELSHTYLGVYVAKEYYGIEDEDILNAIRWHTTGRENMSNLEKLVFISDYIEPARNFESIDKIRDKIYSSLDSSILMALDNTIKYLVDKKIVINIETLKARNYLLRRFNE